MILSFFSGLYSDSATSRIVDYPLTGRKDHWNASNIHSILTNEKYMDDALLQKTYTVDFLTKKKKNNEGEIPQYYVRDHHEAIIPPDTFEVV